MAGEAGDRMRIVIGYALWAAVCATLAGAVLSVIHTGFFSYHSSGPGFWSVLFDDVMTSAGIAAGQGAVALVAGSLLARTGRVLQATVFLGLLVGVFDFVMNFVQMVAPKTELGWIPDLLILAVVTIAITVLGSRPAQRDVL